MCSVAKILQFPGDIYTTLKSVNLLIRIRISSLDVVMTPLSLLQGLVDRVQVYTGTLEDYLNQPNLPKINKANLSDLFEYMSEEASDVVFTALADKMAVGGRITYWNFFVGHYLSCCDQN